MSCAAAADAAVSAGRGMSRSANHAYGQHDLCRRLGGTSDPREIELRARSDWPKRRPIASSDDAQSMESSPRVALRIGFSEANYGISCLDRCTHTPRETSLWLRAALTFESECLPKARDVAP